MRACTTSHFPQALCWAQAMTIQPAKPYVDTVLLHRFPISHNAVVVRGPNRGSPICGTIGQRRTAMPNDNDQHEAKAAEDARRAAEAKAAEDARRAAEAKAAEDARRAAEAKAAEDARRAAEAKAVEDARHAAQAHRAAEARRAAEAKAAEDARRVAEAKAAADARRAV